MEKVMTSFVPQVNGLKFVNRFEFPNLTNISLPLIHSGPISLGEIIYGLCGGMCFTALDYFKSGLAVPNIANVNDINLGLFFYLWDRQLNSMSIGAVEKIIAWMLSDDQTLAEKVAQDEVPKLRSSLDAGQPAVLCLIRARGFSNPTQNHQVTAIGYDLDTDTSVLTIYLYDPNHPGEEPTLSLDLTHPEQSIALSQSTGEPLRGFFVIEYTPQKPPMLSS
jgi:hypothetical protein